MANKIDEHKQKTFVISQLDEIDLDDKDLFLMTDVKGDKVYTKKLTMSHLLKYLGDNPELIQQILEQDQLDWKIQTKVDTKVEEAFKVTEIDGGNAHGFNAGA